MAGSIRFSSNERAPSLLTMASRYAETGRERPIVDHVPAAAVEELLTEQNVAPVVRESTPMEAAAPPAPSVPEPELPIYVTPVPLPTTSHRSSSLRTPIAFGLVGAIAGAAVAFAWPTTYSATSEILIDHPQTIETQMRVLRAGSSLSAVADKLNLASDAEFGGAGTGVLASLLGDGGDAVSDTRRKAIIELGRALSIEQSGGAGVIAVTAQSSDPQKSALIANTISQILVEKAGGQVTDEARLTELRDAVSQAERAVEAFKARNDLVDAQGTLITDEEIQRLGEQLSTARARTVELNSRAASTREANVDSIVTGSLPEQFASPSLSELRARHADARQQLDRLSVKLGPRHPERLAAEAEAQTTRQEISAELRRIASALQTELRRAVEQEQQLASQLAQMKVRQGNIGGELVELRELERQARLKRSSYEQAMRAGEAGSAATGAPSIILRAEAPLSASSPSMIDLAGFGGLAGLGLGFGVSALRRRRDDTSATQDMQTSEETLDQEAGKEPDAMYPYAPYPYAQQPQAQPVQSIPSVPSPAHEQATQPMMQQPPQQAAPQMWPQHMMQPPMPSQPVWPYPQPMQQFMPMHPMHQPMGMPHDPWAHMRGWAMQPMPPMQQPQVIVVQVPQPVQAAQSMVQAQPMMQPQPQYQPQVNAQPVQQHAAPAASEERWTDQEAFIDERTDAAIDEIRRSLREFREAIEDFAEERSVYNPPRRRFGT